MSELNVVRPFSGAGDAAQSSSATAGSGPSTAEGLQLFKAFVGIEDTALRRSIINMIEVLALEAKR